MSALSPQFLKFWSSFVQLSAPHQALIERTVTCLVGEMTRRQRWQLAQEVMGTYSELELAAANIAKEDSRG